MYQQIIQSEFMMTIPPIHMKGVSHNIYNQFISQYLWESAFKIEMIK